MTIDAFSKFVKLYPLRRPTTKAVLRVLRDDYYPKYGKPTRIISDRGTQFTSNEWRNGLREDGVGVTLTSIRHPEGNIVERVNRELGRFFRCLLKKKHSEWLEWITVIESCINEVYHETTEQTPLEIHLGVRPTRFWENALGLSPRQVLSAKERDCKLRLVRANIEEKGKKRSARLKRSTKVWEIAIGDMVLVKANNVSNPAKSILAKFLALYEGPYRVSKQVASATYELFDDRRGKLRGTFHKNNLKGFLC